MVGGRRDQRGVVQSASYARPPLRHPRRHADRPGGPALPAGHLLPGLLRPLPGRLARGAGGAPAILARPWSWRRWTRPISISAAPSGSIPSRCCRWPSRSATRCGAETGLDCSVGIGPNRMIAKLASDCAKPRGLMEVRAGWEEGFLAGLPLAALPGVGPKTAARLGRARPDRRASGAGDGGGRPGAAARRRRAGAQAPGARPRRHHAPRRAAAQVGEPGDDALARPAGPGGAGGDARAAHRAGGGPASRGAAGRRAR